MKGLMIKDFINLKKNLKIFAVLTLLYGFMAFMQGDASFFSTIFTFLFALLTLSTYSYDEMAKWDGYALTMPVSKANIIQGKYLMMILLTFIGSVFSTVILVILNYVLKTDNIFEGLQVCGIGASIIIFFYCITIPIITKLGVEKARFVFFAVYLIPFFAGYITEKALRSGKLQIPEGLIKAGELLLENVYIIVPLILLIALSISYRISIKIYNNKEF